MSRANTLRPNKTTALARVQALIAGTRTHFPSASFTLGSKAYTTATLIQALERLENAIAALNAAHASVADAGTALNEIDAAIGPLVRDYRRHLLAAFSNGVQELPRTSACSLPRTASRSRPKSASSPPPDCGPRAKRGGRRARSRSSPSRGA